jgi:C2 domain
MVENSEEALRLYIEILSCSDLLIRDRKAKSSDPYVKVKHAGKDIHTTKTILKWWVEFLMYCCFVGICHAAAVFVVCFDLPLSAVLTIQVFLFGFASLNPIFTDAQNNAFLLDCDTKELFASNGLLFKVKDYNRLTPDQDIGSIQVPAMELYKATGEVQEYVLEPPSDVPAGTKVGTLQLRCFPATESHMEKLGKKGLRGFVSGIQHKVHSGAQDITHKATAGMKDLGQKVASVPQVVTKTVAPSPSKKEDDSAKSSSEEENNDGIRMVVEIVAGRDLLIGDQTSSGRCPSLPG